MLKQHEALCIRCACYSQTLTLIRDSLTKNSRQKRRAYGNDGHTAVNTAVCVVATVTSAPTAEMVLRQA